MTTSEMTAVIGVGATILLNISALVWGASKLSSKVDEVNRNLIGIKNEFGEFMKEHKRLEKLVGTHTTAIALIAQTTGAKIRKSDLENELAE